MTADRARAFLLCLLAAGMLAGPCAAAPVPGFTEGPRVARAYDAIFNADFSALPALLADTCPPAPAEACLVLEALGTWWRIALDPESTALDRTFSSKVERAIAATSSWTTREPERAEAFFYLGAAYGARVQWRVLRGERLAAARDGKRIKEALDRALALDPDMADARVGRGVYRYYAAIAPAALRVLRWLLMLPGGDREQGLADIRTARIDGILTRSEADYQLHVIDLWYEHRFDEARTLIRSLQARHPRNPLFFAAEAEMAHVYFHDPTTMRLVAEDLLLRSRAGLMNEPALAEARAHLLLAVALDRVAETDRALAHTSWILETKPRQPAGIVQRARALEGELHSRLARGSYRTALDGWRALERGQADRAAALLGRAAATDPRDPMTRYRYAQALLARRNADEARGELEAALTAAAAVSANAAPGTRNAEAAALVTAAAHFDLGTIADADGRRAQAIAHFDAAAHTFGADPRVVRAAERALTRLRPARHRLRD